MGKVLKHEGECEIVLLKNLDYLKMLEEVVEIEFETETEEEEDKHE